MNKITKIILNFVANIIRKRSYSLLKIKGLIQSLLERVNLAKMSRITYKAINYPLTSQEDKLLMIKLKKN